MPWIVCKLVQMKYKLLYYKQLILHFRRALTLGEAKAELRSVYLDKNNKSLPKLFIIASEHLKVNNSELNQTFFKLSKKGLCLYILFFSQTGLQEDYAIEQVFYGVYFVSFRHPLNIDGGIERQYSLDHGYDPIIQFIKDKSDHNDAIVSLEKSVDLALFYLSNFKNFRAIVYTQEMNNKKMNILYKVIRFYKMMNLKANEFKISRLSNIDLVLCKCYLCN